MSSPIKLKKKAVINDVKLIYDKEIGKGVLTFDIDVQGSSTVDDPSLVALAVEAIASLMIKKNIKHEAVDVGDAN